TRVGPDELHQAYPEWQFQIVRELDDIKHIDTAGGSSSLIPVPQGPGIARWLLLVMLALVLIEVVPAWIFCPYTAVHEGYAATAGATASPGERWLRGFLTGSLIFLLICSAVVGATLIHAAATGDFLGFLSDDIRGDVEQQLGVRPPESGERIHWPLRWS